MIPKIIHYCWFGRSELPQVAQDCIASWHKHMPEWEYILWNEDNFEINSLPYVKEAYEAKKYAFVSDVVRLFALKEYGGIYLDTDVEVYKSFESILQHSAFAGFEGSKFLPIGTCVIGSERNGSWICKQLVRYSHRHFCLNDGSYDMTTNVTFITKQMMEDGLICDGKEKDFDGLHIFPVDYFSPRQTTGEYFRTENTYCDHLGLDSWGNKKKPLILRIAGPKISIKLIKIKRRLLG